MINLKTCQTVLPDRSTLIGQKLMENAKYENSNATFSVISKHCARSSLRSQWVINETFFSDFQSLCYVERSFIQDFSPSFWHIFGSIFAKCKKLGSTNTFLGCGIERVGKLRFFFAPLIGESSWESLFGKLLTSEVREKPWKQDLSDQFEISFSA